MVTFAATAKNGTFQLKLMCLSLGQLLDKIGLHLVTLAACRMKPEIEKFLSKWIKMNGACKRRITRSQQFEVERGIKI